MEEIKHGDNREKILARAIQVDSIGKKELRPAAERLPVQSGGHAGVAGMEPQNQAIHGKRIEAKSVVCHENKIAEVLESGGSTRKRIAGHHVEIGLFCYHSL